MERIEGKTMARIKCNLLYFIAALFVASFFCLSCTEKNVVYNESCSFPNSSWNMAEKATFNVSISDTSDYYRLGILVRNDGNYPYQNLWLFVDCTTPDSIVVSDTVQFFLCDDYGRWIGSSSIGSLYTTVFLYQDSVKFNKSGDYTYSITQAMRNDLLYGISDVGLKVVSLSE